MCLTVNSNQCNLLGHATQNSVYCHVVNRHSTVIEFTYTKFNGTVVVKLYTWQNVG